MEKFELNKRVIARMERPEMADVNGGFTYLISGPRGSRMGKRCCGAHGFHLQLYPTGVRLRIGGQGSIECARQ